MTVLTPPAVEKGLSTPLHDLVERIRARKQRGSDPYILLLGKDCARAAGQPLETVSKSIAQFLQSSLPQASGDILPALTLPGGQIIDAVHNWTLKLSPSIGFGLLRVFYSQLPVPLFYQDLARLIKLGYFRQVLTTNFDDLLEQALTTSGMTAGRDFSVLNVPDANPDDINSGNAAADSAPVEIIKLHGDLARSNAELRPEAIEALLLAHRAMVKSDLRGDVILFGYDGESPPTEQFLAHSAGQELWWVRAAVPPPGVIRASLSREFHQISGEDGAANTFFAKLYEGLQRIPVLQAMRVTTKGSSVLTEQAQSLSAQRASDDDEHAEFLRGQIRRAQRLLKMQQQSLVPGEEDTSILSQIEYQTKQIAAMEDELRALENNRHKLLQLVDSLIESVDKAGIEDSTKAFLHTQRDVLHREFSEVKPNHFVISAAVDATATIGARLGSDLVDSNLVRSLNSFAPTRVVI